jgi:biopolymer transport protein ExbD
MAEFPPPTRKHVGGKRQTKKLSTNVDLTPMVDLGFLLITFFILTTSLTEPKSLKLIMPDDRPTPTPTVLSETATLQLVLDKGDKVWYYNGNESDEIRKTSYGTELRKVIINKKKSVQQKLGFDDDMTIVIKPTAGSSLKNIVSILDEVLINQVKHYVITEPNEQDRNMIEADTIISVQSTHSHYF